MNRNEWSEYIRTVSHLLDKSMRRNHMASCHVLPLLREGYLCKNMEPQKSPYPMTDPWCCYIWCAMDPIISHLRRQASRSQWLGSKVPSGQRNTAEEQSSWGRRIRSNDVKCHIFLCKKCEKPLESDESWFQEDFTPVLSSWPMRTEAFPKPQGRQLERILPNSRAWQLARARWHLMHPICVPDCHPSPG